MNMKNFVMILFGVFFITSVISTIMLSQVYQQMDEDTFKSALPVEGKQIKEVSTDSQKIRAMLKGSIYESGEEMTVFGACFDGWGYLLPSANATFSSWYPNGTLQLNDTAMTSVSNTGRWRIQVNMSDTSGTYLTQIKCTLGGEFALAFGEWQNPVWVARIKDTQDAVGVLSNLTIGQYNNISTLIQDFSDETQVNFSQVLNAIGGINISAQIDFSTDFTELYNMMHSIDTSYWVIDDQAPWYSFGSGAFEFTAVDMLSVSDIFAVSSDGYAVYWDGETWQLQSNYSDIAWYGVSVLPASTPYAWYVGQNTTANTSVYSVNGGTPSTLNGSTGSIYYDVKLFPDPNSPSSNYYGYVLEDDGKVWYSSDAGVTFVNIYNFSTTGDGRFSQIVDNTDLGVTDGYRLAAVMGNELMYFNGTGYETYTATNQDFYDVELVYNDEAYAISKDTVTNELKVFKFNGTGLELVYKANDTTIIPTGIAAAAPIDIWVVTNNPSVFYHYNGISWEYSNYPYSGAIGVGVLFTNGTIPGLYDIYVFDAKNAYAVGTDGLIMKYYSMFDERFDSIINDLTNLSALYNLAVTMNSSINDLTTVVNYINSTTTTINSNVVDIIADLSAMNVTLVNISGELYDVKNIVIDVNETLHAMNISLTNSLIYINSTLIDTQTVVYNINTSLNDLTSIVISMNATIIGSLDDLSTKIDLLNISMNTRFDQVIANITYTQLYLNTTIYPALQLILTRLGVIEANVNETLRIANETYIIVNETATGVEELVNKSRRIYAWVQH